MGDQVPEGKKEAEVLGPPLLEVSAMVYRSPVPSKAIRAIWQVPDAASNTLLFMLWLSLARELLTRFPSEAPAVPVLQKAVDSFDAAVAAAKGSD